VLRSVAPNDLILQAIVHQLCTKNAAALFGAFREPKCTSNAVASRRLWFWAKKMDPRNFDSCITKLRGGKARVSEVGRYVDRLFFGRSNKQSSTLETRLTWFEWSCGGQGRAPNESCFELDCRLLYSSAFIWREDEQLENGIFEKGCQRRFKSQ